VISRRRRSLRSNSGALFARDAEEAKKPEAEGDKRDGRGAELPLVKAGKDFRGIFNFIEKGVQSRKERDHATDNARCEQDGPLEASLVLIHPAIRDAVVGNRIKD
jgi:hypothetical protein